MSEMNSVQFSAWVQVECYVAIQEILFNGAVVVLRIPPPPCLVPLVRLIWIKNPYSKSIRREEA